MIKNCTQDCHASSRILHFSYTLTAIAVPSATLHPSCPMAVLAVCLPGCLLGYPPQPPPQDARLVLSALSPVANVLFAVSLRFLDFWLVLLPFKPRGNGTFCCFPLKSPFPMAFPNFCSNAVKYPAAIAL